MSRMPSDRSLSRRRVLQGAAALGGLAAPMLNTVTSFAQGGAFARAQVEADIGQEEAQCEQDLHEVGIAHGLQHLEAFRRVQQAGQ